MIVAAESNKPGFAEDGNLNAWAVQWINSPRVSKTAELSFRVMEKQVTVRL